MRGLSSAQAQLENSRRVCRHVFRAAELGDLNIDCHQSMVEGCSRDIYSCTSRLLLLQGLIRLLGTEEVLRQRCRPGQMGLGKRAAESIGERDWKIMSLKAPHSRLKMMKERICQESTKICYI